MMLNDGGLTLAPGWWWWVQPPKNGSLVMKTAGVLLTWEIEDQKWATKINMNHHESKIKTYQDLEGGWFTGKPSVIFYKWRIRFLVTPACLPCRFLRGGPAQGRTGRGRGDSCGGAPSADVAGHALVPCLGSWASGYWWNLMQSDGFRPQKLEDFSKHRVHRCFWLW